MVRGLYTAGSGMLTSSRKLDIVSNNIANSKTTGYKQDDALTASFRNTLVENGGTGQQLGSLNMGQSIDGVHTSFEQGPLQATGNPYDLAISGEGFFTVQGPNNMPLYTRNGEFAVDTEGFIISTSGGRLMGENGAINTGGKSFTVDKDGGVYVDDKKIDTLAIYNPVNTDSLVKHNNGMFYDTGNTAQKPFKGSITQGSIEASNVNMINEMMEMMRSQRSFQSNSQVVKMIDETLEKAVSIGRMG